MLISDNLPVRKSYFDSKIIKNENARILRHFFHGLFLIGRRQKHVYMRRHQGAKVEHFDVSNVIYHKFSQGAIFCTLCGENVNVMLESVIQNRYLCTARLTVETPKTLTQ